MVAVPPTSTTWTSACVGVCASSSFVERLVHGAIGSVARPPRPEAASVGLTHHVEAWAHGLRSSIERRHDAPLWGRHGCATCCAGCADLRAGQFARVAGGRQFPRSCHFRPCGALELQPSRPWVKRNNSIPSHRACGGDAHHWTGRTRRRRFPLDLSRCGQRTA